MRNATAPVAGPYHDFVQEQAQMNSALTGTDQGITYNAVVSTLADNIPARQNAPVEAPVYLMDGTFIASGFDDLWNTANIDNRLLPAPINVTQSGLIDMDASQVATGTLFDGTISTNPVGNLPGINEISIMGDALSRSPQWIDDQPGSNGQLFDYRFYALSEKITVGAVPLPGAALLFGSALGMLGWMRRRAT